MLPTRAGFRVIRKNDPDLGLTDDEIQDRIEFIRCYLFKDFELLMMIPKQTCENDFFVQDCDVCQEEYSAFNTHDYQRHLRPFNKYAYAMKKVMERVKDLAIMHSCCTYIEDQTAVSRKYQAYIERKFRSRLLNTIKQYRQTQGEKRRHDLKQRIKTLNRRILECRRIWERYAPAENWDF